MNLPLKIIDLFIQYVEQQNRSFLLIEMFAENKNYFRMVTQNTQLIYVMSVLTQGNRLALSPAARVFLVSFLVMCQLFMRLPGLNPRVNQHYTVYQTPFHLDIHQSFLSNFANFCILTIQAYANTSVRYFVKSHSKLQKSNLGLMWMFKLQLLSFFFIKLRDRTLAQIYMQILIISNNNSL